MGTMLKQSALSADTGKDEMKYPNIKAMLEKWPADWRLLDYYSDHTSLLCTPEGTETDWIEQDIHRFAVGFNHYVMEEWDKLSDEQKEAVDQYSFLMLGDRHSKLIAHYEAMLQVNKECAEYDAPLGTIDLEKEVW